MTQKEKEIITEQFDRVVKAIESQQKHYGFYQLCPMCEGEGVLPSTNTTSMWVTCHVCNGAKLLVMPEIKPNI